MADPPPLPKAVLFNVKTPPHIFTLVVLAGVGAMNMNIILPSLPFLASHFQTDYVVVQLAVSAYLGMTAILQLFTGPLSDRFGRRPIIVASFVIFILASLLTANATSFEMYMAGRLLQAVIVTGYTLSRAIIRDMVPMEQAASMIGYVTMGMALVPMVAPTIGGILQETLGWQSVNYFVAILGTMMLLLTWFDLGETNQHKSVSFKAQFHDYPELLKSRRFWGYAFTSMFASGSYFAFLGGAPYAAEKYFELTPTQLGNCFILMAVGYMFGNFLSGRFSERIGIAKMMIYGAFIASIGIMISLLLFYFGANHTMAFFLPVAAVGWGNGMTLPSAMAGMVSVRSQLAGSAAGLGGTLMVGGGAALSILPGILLTPVSGPTPLLWLMLISAAFSVASIAYSTKIENDLANTSIKS